MRISLALLGLAVAFLLALGAAGAPRASAGGIVFPTGGDCDAKIGVERNDGDHPEYWTDLAAMDVTLSPHFPDGSRDIKISTTDPNVLGPPPVTGTIKADGSITAAGETTYAGYDTTVTFKGDMTFWDKAMLYPKRITGHYTVGGDGRLPGGKTIVYHSDCFYPAPLLLIDKDGDGYPAILRTQSDFASTAEGQMSPWLYTHSEPQGVPVADTLMVRDETGVAHAFAVIAAAFGISDSKGGPFEGDIGRKLYDIKGKFGGAFDINHSQVQFNFPSVLEATQGVTSSPVSGYFNGSFLMDPTTAGISNFDFNFSVSGFSLPLLGGTAQTGPWQYYRDPSRDVTGTVNPATGNFSLNVPTLFWSPNLQLKNPNPQPQAASADLGGLPIPFTETVTGTFGSLAQLAGAIDNCPDVANPNQADSNHNGLGDACEGFVWGDPSCDGFAGAHDALDTLLQIANEPVTPEHAGCPHFNDHVKGLTFGDWNCDGQITSLDALILLEFSADAPRPTPVAQCPDLETFISTVGA